MSVEASNAKRSRETRAALCILASSSQGNCSVVHVSRGAESRLIVIDAGLSPRRTRALMSEAGVRDVPIAAVVLTHLDVDHWHPGWSAGLPSGAMLYMHRQHLGRAAREGSLHQACTPFDGAFEVMPGVVFVPMLMSHDSLGVACFRVEVAGASLGWATDVGRPTESLARHLRGVDVLAVESNYCPRMQMESDRPAYLKSRIMGGSGHLSNQQTRALTQRIEPRRHVVLLHLSQQCNTPELARAQHVEAPYELTLASPREPTSWIPLVGCITPQGLQGKLWTAR